MDRWNYIQKTFPDKVQRRLAGQDDDDVDDSDSSATRAITAVPI